MIKTWRQRCEEHPDHNGIVSEGMIRARMQEEIDELRAAMAQAQEPIAWHPIETAPKDRTFLACRRHSTMPTMAKWNAEYEWFEDLNMDHLYDLTHWMPMPPAPGTAPRKWQGLTNQEALNAAVYVFCQLAGSPEEQKQIARDLGKACNEPHSALMRFAATIEELLEEKNR